MRIASRIIALLLVLTFGFGMPVMQAGAAMPDASTDQVGFALQVVDPSEATAECEHCTTGDHAASGGSCSVVCVAVPLAAQDSTGLDFILRKFQILPDQSFGRAGASPELQPPRLTILA